MHRVVKTLAERVLLHAGPATLSRRAHRGRSLILAYHNVVPDGETISGDESLHLPRNRFSEQLDRLLEEEIEVVSLDELMAAPGQADTSRRVAITFDDAYSGALSSGVEELLRRNLPATFFAVPGLLGGGTFWWDALSTAGPDREVRDAALLEARGRNDEVLAWAKRQGLPIRTVPEHARSASEAQLLTAGASRGIAIASHTWSHPNLSLLNEAACRSEFRRANEWLRERIGTEPRWLAYPYGLLGEAAERAAATTGYRAAFRIDGGWLPRRREPHNLYRTPRLNVPAGISSDGFALRLAGLLK